MKHNNSYSQARTQLLKQVNQLELPASNNSQHDTSTSIKIDSYLKTISQLQSHIAHLQRNIQYCQTVTDWIQAAINHKPQATTLGIKSLMNAYNRINTLEKQAITYKPQHHTKFKHASNEPQSKCIMSAHLRYILNPKPDPISKIKQLMQTRDALYTQIHNNLIKQQPYLHQKIMKKIQREVKRQTKLSAISQLQAICKEKQKWLGDSKKELSDRIDEKIVEQKVTNNLQKMKEIINKKIINNQYIGTLVQDQNTTHKNIGRLDKSVAEIKRIVRQQLKQMDDISLQKQLQQIQKQKQQQLQIVQFDSQYVTQINDLMERGHSLLSQSLGSPSTDQLHQQCDRLNQQLQYKIKRNY